jgi:hypothetical protein
MPGTGSVYAWQEKTPPILPFTNPTESDQRPRLCRRNAPKADERYCHRIPPANEVFGTHRVPKTSSAGRIDGKRPLSANPIERVTIVVAGE